MRDAMSEERILQGSLALTAIAAVLAAAFGGVLGAAVVALGLGIGASAGKLAFDSIVQRDAPDANRGRSFARFETRFQLFWVIGGFLPVVVALPARIGYLVVAGAAGFALFTYMAGVRTRTGRDPGTRILRDAGRRGRPGGHHPRASTERGRRAPALLGAATPRVARCGRARPRASTSFGVGRLRAVAQSGSRPSGPARSTTPSTKRCPGRRTPA